MFFAIQRNGGVALAPIALIEVFESATLEAAVNERADVLVTHNVRHFAKGAAMFGLRVLQPGELLKELRS